MEDKALKERGHTANGGIIARGERTWDGRDPLPPPPRLFKYPKKEKEPNKTWKQRKDNKVLLEGQDRTGQDRTHASAPEALRRNEKRKRPRSSGHDSYIHKIVIQQINVGS